MSADRERKSEMEDERAQTKEENKKANTEG
jgi:hypothetical protein